MTRQANIQTEGRTEGGQSNIKDREAEGKEIDTFLRLKNLFWILILIYLINFMNHFMTKTVKLYLEGRR